MEFRSVDVLAKEFNTIVRGLISKLERKSRSDIEVANLDRLRKRISLLKATAGELSLISESSPFFIEYSDQIINRDEKFFNSMDVRSEYIKRKGTVNKQDEFIFSLTESIRGHYNKASQKEKDELYAEVKSLFEACVEYEIAVAN